MTERYRIESTLGAGGQALVTKATDVLLDRPVAIKSLAPFFGSEATERDRERLKREARALAALSHPQIPAVYDVFLDSSPPQIVFEFVDGDNLLTVLKRRRPTIREVCRWMLQACAALSHAHAAGIIHRDIKPPNLILRATDGSCCVVDFGLATLPGESLGTTSRFYGTPGYMAPEQLRGEVVDARADVFSLAVTMYQLLANKLPAPEEYETLSSIDPVIPPAVDALIQDSLRARSSRPADANEFAQRLKDAVAVSVSLSDLLDSSRLLGELADTLQQLSPSQHGGLIQQLMGAQQRLRRVHGLVNDGMVSLSDLGIHSGGKHSGILIPLKEAVKKFRREYILEALERCGNNRSQTARALDVDPRTIFRFLAAEDDD